MPGKHCEEAKEAQLEDSEGIGAWSDGLDGVLDGNFGDGMVSNAKKKLTRAEVTTD